MKNQPIVAVNLVYLIPGEVGGSETVIRSVLPELFGCRPDWRFILITTLANHETFADASNVTRHRVDIDPHKRTRRILWEQLRLPSLLKRLHADILLSPAYYGPLRWPGKHAVFVHDMNFRRHPEDFTPLHCWVWRILVPATCRRADRILTSSRFAKSEIERFYPDCNPKIVVTPYGSDHVAAVEAKPPNLSKPYFLCVARWYPHKNLPVLVHSFVQSGLPKDFQLIMVGGGTGARRPMLEWIAQQDLQQSVQFKTALSWPDLVSLFQHCHLLVSPSKYEGFGLPLLEAMRLRAPILCSDLPIHREVTAGHAHFFPLDDPDDLRRKMIDLAGNDAKRTAHLESACRHALEQTWANTAQAFADAFGQLFQ